MTNQTKDDNLDSSTSVWSIRRLYQQAWKLTVENKKLWLFGFVFVALALGGGYSSYSSSNNNNSFSDPQINEEMVMNLGQNPQVIKFQQELAQGVASVPKPVYALLSAELVAVMGYVVVVFLIVSSWSRAALILAVSKAAVGKLGRVADISYTASKRVSSLIWLSLVPSLGGFISLVIWFVILALLSSLYPVVAICLMVVTVLVAGYLFLKLGLSLMWAERAAVLEGLSGKAALISGWHLANGNMLKTLKLLIATAVTIGLVNFIIVLSLTLLGATTAFPFNGGNDSLSQIAAHYLIISIVPLIVFTFANALQYVFIFATYHYAYSQLRQMAEKKKVA